MRLEVIAALVVAAAASPAQSPYGSYSRYWPHPREAEIEQRAAPVTYRYYPPPTEAVGTKTEGEDELQKREPRNSDDDSYNAYQPHPKRAIPVHATYRWYEPPVKRAKPVSSLVDYDKYAREIDDDAELVKRDRPSHGNYQGYGKYGEKRTAEEEEALDKRDRPSHGNYQGYGKYGEKRADENEETLSKRINDLYGNYGGYDRYHA